jgi:hypothetical protein
MLIECRIQQQPSRGEGLSKNFLVGLLGIGSSSENASLGLLMKPSGKNQSKNQVPVPMVGVKKNQMLFWWCPQMRRRCERRDVSSPQGHDGVRRDIDG